MLEILEKLEKLRNLVDCMQNTIHHYILSFLHGNIKLIKKLIKQSCPLESQTFDDFRDIFFFRFFFNFEV